MSKVQCDIEQTSLAGDYGDVEDAAATCSRCGHKTESYGTSERSKSRCLALMNEECPNGENNFYEED